MTVLDNCYWWGNSSVVKESKGQSNSSGYTVIAKGNVDIAINDVVYLGEGFPIASKRDLPQHDIFIVTSINRLLKGSKLDHTEFSGN